MAVVDGVAVVVMKVSAGMRVREEEESNSAGVGCEARRGGRNEDGASSSTRSNSRGVEQAHALAPALVITLGLAATRMLPLVVVGREALQRRRWAAADRCPCGGDGATARGERLSLCERHSERNKGDILLLLPPPPLLLLLLLVSWW